MILVRELAAGSRRFNDLRRGLPLMSPTMLSRRLRQLIDADVVQHVVDNDGMPLYELTRAGNELRPLIEFMGTWGHRWVGSHLEEDDLDVGLLMWDIRRGVDPEQFPREQVTIQIEFSDALDARTNWWLISENGETDLCMEDPGHEVDVLVRTTVGALTAIWLCRYTLADAEHTGELRVMGDSKWRKLLPTWLRGSPLARLGEESLRTDPVT